MTDQAKTWDDYDAAALQNFRAGLNFEEMSPEQKAQVPSLDALIARKLAAEEATKVQDADNFKSLAKKLDAKATKMFPELEDRESEMAKKTDEYLGKMKTGTTDPNALLNASMLAADDLGLDPAQYRDTPDPDKTGGGNHKPVDTDKASDADLFKRTSKLAEMLEAENVLDLSKDGVKDRILANHENLMREGN